MTKLLFGDDEDSLVQMKINAQRLVGVGDWRPAPLRASVVSGSWISTGKNARPSVAIAGSGSRWL